MKPAPLQLASLSPARFPRFLIAEDRATAMKQLTRFCGNSHSDKSRPAPAAVPTHRGGRLLLLFLLGVALGPALAAAVSPPTASSSYQPRLSRSTIRLAPTPAQVATIPDFDTTWKLPAAMAAQLPAIMEAGRFPEAFAAGAQAGLSIDPATGDGAIAPSEALLGLLSERQRARWWSALARYNANLAHRWPLALRTSTLDALANDARWAEAVDRMRRFGVQHGARTLFADFFVLEGAFPGVDARGAFFRELLGVETEFLKLRVAGAASELESILAYWNSGSLQRVAEPILASVAMTENQDYLDIAHLLPQLPRSLLYTYPPSFENWDSPSMDNAAMAASFFALGADSLATFGPGGFSAWLETQCEPVAGERRFGDIVVFEDPSAFRWPFAMVHIADGIVFGRRPCVFGPWELMPESDIPLLNPRMEGGAVSVFRARAAIAPGRDAARISPLPRLPSGRVESLPAGPWGRLVSHEVTLFPPNHLLQSLDAPARDPVWTFYGTSKAAALRAVAEAEMPAREKAALQAVFARAEPDSRGLLTVRPSRALALATPASVREKLFPKLVHGASAADYAQDIVFPTRLPPEQWFGSDLMSEQARQLAISLSYRNGSLTLLSDFGAFYHGIAAGGDRIAALRGLMRTPALVLLLERPTVEEAASLADYWRLDQQKSVRGLLESFAASATMDHLDIIHLLPPLAREFMNVYARTPYGAPSASCYWTALNFHELQPDSRLLVTPQERFEQMPLVWEKLRRAYRRVEQAEQIGDLIAYRDKSNGDLRHVCSFVAAGVVFSKNGFGSVSPWCLMRLDDVDALYLNDSVERWIFRLREPATAGPAR